MNNTIVPKVPFTPEELEYIKKQNNPEYNKDLIQKEITESLGIPFDHFHENLTDNKEYPINVLNNPEGGNIVEINQPVSIDPNTGSHTPISNKDMNEVLGADISLDQIDDFNVDDIQLNESDAESIQSLFGTDINDSLSFINIMKEVKAGNNKNLFSRLPKIMKQQLVGTCGTTNPAVLNKAAKEFMDLAISQIGTDQAFVDLETGMKNATDELMVGYKEMAKESIKIEDDDYDIRLKLYVDDIRKNHPEKEDEAIKWETVRQRYLDAVDFSEIINAITTNPKLTKKLDKYSRMVRDFNYKYTSETKKTKFACRDINYATNVLARVLDAREYPSDLIKKFICVICNYVKNFDATDINDHTFMYFTVKSIVCLETLNYNEDKFINIISSIKEILNILKED